MNVRKNIDYSEMYQALDGLMVQQLLQMELYCEIGKAVCRRTEKGAAVMASEYLNKQYPDVKGFSPRSLRRMRDVYRTYENHPALLSLAMQIGWIHNVVIMESDLTMELREWYMKAALQFAWTKAELADKINGSAHEKISLDIEMKQDEPANRTNCINYCQVIVSALKETTLMLIRESQKQHELNLARRWRDHFYYQYSYSKAALRAFSSSNGMPFFSRR